MTIQPIAQFIATLCAALFSGAALYTNCIEHPARLECGVELAATVFRPSDRRATIMQAFLAVLGFVSVEVAWLSGGDLSWLVGGLLLGLVVPLTLLVIKPINTQLLAPSLGRSGGDQYEYFHKTSDDTLRRPREDGAANYLPRACHLRRRKFHWKLSKRFL